jgi:hypothetical protein
MKMVNYLFMKFTCIYHAKWTSVFSDDVVIALAKGEWLSVVEELTTQQIDAAVNICKNTMEWAPSCAMFRKIALGIPSPAQALLEVHNRMKELQDCKKPSDFSHSVVEDAYRSIGGSYTSRNSSAIEYKRLFDGAYDALVKQFLVNVGKDDA